MQRPGAPLSYSAERDLRRLLEGRERELENQRKRMGRIFTVVMLGGFALMAVAVFLFPTERKDAKKAEPNPVAKALATPNMPQVFAPVAEDKDMKRDLQPFAISPGKEGNKENLHFAEELLRFIQPQGQQGQPAAAPARPAASH